MSERKLSVHCLHLDSKQLAYYPMGTDRHIYPKCWPRWPAAWRRMEWTSRAAPKLFLLAHLLLPPSRPLGSRDPGLGFRCAGNWVGRHLTRAKWGRLDSRRAGDCSRCPPRKVHHQQRTERKVPISRRTQSLWREYVTDKLPPIATLQADAVISFWKGRNTQQKSHVASDY